MSCEWNKLNDVNTHLFYNEIKEKKYKFLQLYIFGSRAKQEYVLGQWSSVRPR